MLITADGQTQPRMLILGSSGQLGQALIHQLGTQSHVYWADRARLDLTDAATLQRLLYQLGPDLVINAAAYTAVDQAEQDAWQCDQINHRAVQALAQGCAELGAGLIQVSSNYVYDGQQQRPYLESDPVCPLNVYGQSKAAAEQAIIDSGCPHVILRTSALISPWRQNFVRSICQLLQSRSVLSVVADQWVAPTSALWLAHVIAKLAAQWPHLAQHPHLQGIYHANAAGQASWFEVAERVKIQAQQQGLQADRGTPALIQPIAAAERNDPAQRPRNGLLDCSKLRQVFGIQPPVWQSEVDTVVRQIWMNRPEEAV